MRYDEPRHVWLGVCVCVCGNVFFNLLVPIIKLFAWVGP